MGGDLRILQIGELRLNRPLAGCLRDIPAQLESVLFNAKYLATSPTLLDVRLNDLYEAQPFRLTPADKQKLLSTLQARANSRPGQVWPYRVDVAIDLETAPQTDSRALQVAFAELQNLRLDEVYANLDLHVLEIGPDSLDRLKARVALRLSGLLKENRPQLPRHLT